MRVMPVAWPMLIGIASIAIVMHYTMSFTYALPFWLMAIGIGWLHRDPPTVVPSDPMAIVSPVDGYITRIDYVESAAGEGLGCQIDIKKGFGNLYHLRSPIEGTVREIKLFAKKNLVGRQSTEVEPYWKSRERIGNTGLLQPYAIKIQTDEQDEVVLIAQAARLLRRPRIDIRTGERLGQGQVFGYTPFGRRYSLWLPNNVQLLATQGDVVRGGSSVLAKLTHHNR